MPVIHTVVFLLFEPGEALNHSFEGPSRFIAYQAA